MTTPSAIERNFPTLRYAVMPFRWVFRSRRLRAIAAAVLAAMVIAPPLWWSIQLLGLPDIGDPFDVAEFRSFRVPDDRNAFVLYREAADWFRGWDKSPDSEEERADPRVRWSKAAPIIRRWLGDNQKAMDLYRRGAERPDAMPPADLPDVTHNQMRFQLAWFQALALLEASRLEDEQGDLAAAWIWYRTALRASYHVGRYGTTDSRRAASHWRAQLGQRLKSWAADRRTTPELLRRALDDVLACEVLAPSESYTLKALYLELLEVLEGPHSPGRGGVLSRLKGSNIGWVRYLVDEDWLPTIADAWLSWRREPERSRRVLRLVIANWLAYEELPPDRRPQPALDVTGPLDLYALSPEAPPGARPVARGPGPMVDERERGPDGPARPGAPSHPDRRAGRVPGPRRPVSHPALPPRPRSGAGLRAGTGRAVPEGPARRRPRRRGRSRRSLNERPPRRGRMAMTEIGGDPPPHPAAIDPDALADECEFRATRRSGPGGQNRNKVETAVILTHRPTGLRAEASERRTQGENRRAALRRLRIELAIEVRRPFDRAGGPGAHLWRSRCRGGRIAINPDHDDFPAMLAEALDVLAAVEDDPRTASEWLGCSSTQLVKLVKEEPRAIAAVNERRRRAGRHPLR